MAHALLANISAFIMSLDLGSGTVKHYNTSWPGALNSSIFINGNLARVLLGSHRLNGNATHLAEGLAWCEAFVKNQVIVPTATAGIMGGFWGVGYPTSVPLDAGSLYLGDTGTAVTALAQCAADSPDAAQRARFLAALKLYDAFVRYGCTTAGCGATRRGTTAAKGGFINASAGGSIGCGYYKGHLSTCPYVIATGTTGAAFEGELLALTRHQEEEVDAASDDAAVKLITDSVHYMARVVSKANASIPYLIDCEHPDWLDWPLDTATYVIEGLLAAYLRLPALRPSILDAFKPTTEWLLRIQNGDGSWGSAAHLQDRLRSPRVTSLLALQHIAALTSANSETPDPRLLAALVKYVRFLAVSGGGGYGVGMGGELRVNGFAGLALLELIQFGVTFIDEAKLPAR